MPVAQPYPDTKEQRLLASYQPPRTPPGDPIGRSAATHPVDMPAIEAAGALAQTLGERADLIADRLQRTVTRAFGEAPANAEKSQIRPVPCGAVGLLRDKLSIIEEALRAAAEAVDRLDTLV